MLLIKVSLNLDGLFISNSIQPWSHFEVHIKITHFYLANIVNQETCLTSKMFCMKILMFSFYFKSFHFILKHFSWTLSITTSIKHKQTVHIWHIYSATKKRCKSILPECMLSVLSKLDIICTHNPEANAHSSFLIKIIVHFIIVIIILSFLITVTVDFIVINIILISFILFVVIAVIIHQNM